MHGLKTPLFGLARSRPASPAPKTSPPYVPPLVPTGAITPLDLSTPASPIEGPKDIPRRPLTKLHQAFRRASPSPAPCPAPTPGSNYLDALALRISEAAGKAISPPIPAHNSDGLFLHGRRPLPTGRGKLLGQVIQSEIQHAQHGGHDLLRASLRALHRPLNVLLANVSTLLAPLVVVPPSHVLVPASPWVQLGASQAHALGLAMLVAELLESLDSLPTDCAKVGGEGLRSIKQGLEGVISRVVQPVLTAVRTELAAFVDALEAGPLVGKKENPLVGPVGVAIKVLARIASIPGPVAGGAMAACEIGIVWRAMVALAHRKHTKPSLPKRLTPPNTPPPARFLLPASRPPSPPNMISPAVQLAHDAKTVLGLLDPMPRPMGQDAKEAVGEAFDAFKRFVDVLGLLAQPNPDTSALIRLVDGEPQSLSPDEEDELPALLVLPALLHGQSIPSILGIDEIAYRERCLSGFGRAEASEGVVLRAVLARMDEVGVPGWVKEWMVERVEG
ncbi:hypothetical protein RSOL_262120 [Rhizoctonia solani AG-3 Rhs1AP]|uniref:Uncharacterized protein n=1 Tax=Rhizoctonia solani AG-3 Rhs1AP TaxID=1086054 RepID=A0A0A1UI19_9AGAM|nr:hypothetical protein RSOL_262120 [Rhizoctonia solani AG-3 Rhs1AP]